MFLDPYIPAIALAYAGLQVAALALLKGAWARAASVPAVFMALALVLFIVGMLIQRPLATVPLGLGLPLSVLYLAALWLAWAAATLRRSA